MVRSWLDDLSETPPPADGPAVEEVVLMRYPVVLAAADRDRTQHLLDELRSLAATDDPRRAKRLVPMKLLDLADHVTGTYGGQLQATLVRREEAERSGRQTIDLAYPVVAETRAIIIDYARAMEQLDVFCRAGMLSTPATPVLQYALRKWICSEFVAQCDGAAPRPWDGPIS